MARAFVGPDRGDAIEVGVGVAAERYQLVVDRRATLRRKRLDFSIVPGEPLSGRCLDLVKSIEAPERRHIEQALRGSAVVEVPEQRSQECSRSGTCERAPDRSQRPAPPADGGCSRALITG